MMETKEGKALMAYEEDIEQRDILDWVKAHTSFLKPLHRYEGDIVLLEDKIVFKGKDTKTESDYSVEINKGEVRDVYLGFDDVFKRREDRSLGLGFQPLRLKFTRDDKEYTMYLIIDFNRVLRTTKNKEWYKEFERWRG